MFGLYAVQHLFLESSHDSFEAQVHWRPRGDPCLWPLSLIDYHTCYATLTPPSRLTRWIKLFQSFQRASLMVLAVKHLSAKSGDMGLIPGSGRYRGEGNGNPLQYACLENPMDRAAWWATVHGATKKHNWVTEHKALKVLFNSKHQGFYMKWGKSDKFIWTKRYKSSVPAGHVALTVGWCFLSFLLAFHTLWAREQGYYAWRKRLDYG